MILINNKKILQWTHQNNPNKFKGWSWEKVSVTTYIHSPSSKIIYLHWFHLWKDHKFDYYVESFSDWEDTKSKERDAQMARYLINFL